MKIRAVPTFKQIPLVPVVVVLALIIVLVPILGMEGLWISAAAALAMAIAYANRQTDDKRMHFDYKAFDWLLFGDVYLIERVLNIAESENRRALITYSPKKYPDVLSAKALELLCRRRLIEVEVHSEKGARLDLSLTGPKGKLVIRAKSNEDLKYRLDKMLRRGWEKSADQSEASGKFDCAMLLPMKESVEERNQQAVKAQGMAVIWFEDRTMATVRLTDGPMPSQGLPADKLPSVLTVVKMKKYPGTNIIASVRVKDYKPEYSDQLRQVAEECGTVAWIKGEPRDIAAWMKGRHTLDGDTIEDE